jgi:hypothetical protein
MGLRKATVLIASISLIAFSGCTSSSTVSTEPTAKPDITINETIETSSNASESTSAPTETTIVTEEETSMVLMIGDTEVPVTWEDNASVEELKTLAGNGLMISMSMYGGFEQVGSIGQSIARDDEQITTSSGDIVLYSGDQIVIFYGSNSWAYTKLGKINLSEEEMTSLLSNGDVTITLIYQ